MTQQPHTKSFKGKSLNASCAQDSFFIDSISLRSSVRPTGTANTVDDRGRHWVLLMPDVLS